MRGVSRVVRSVAVLSLMVALAAPMQAASSDDATWIGRNRQRIVKFLNKHGLRTLGDLLEDPRP